MFAIEGFLEHVEQIEHCVDHDEEDLVVRPPAVERIDGDAICQQFSCRLEVDCRRCQHPIGNAVETHGEAGELFIVEGGATQHILECPSQGVGHCGAQ